MAVRVLCNFYLKDDGHLEEQMKIMIDASLKDKGCISYQFYQNFLNKDEYIMVEHWESKELLDAHMKTKHFADVIEYTNKIAIKPAVIKVIEEK